MKIICQSCQSKYNVADDKVQGKTVKIRCRKCGATIVVSGNGAAAEHSPALAPSAGLGASAGDGEGQYHVNVSDGDQRTMTIPEIVQAYNTGVVNQETYLWTDGMDDWLPLAQVDAIVGALNAAALAPAPMGGPDAPTVETAAAAGHVAAQPEAKRAAVVRREGRANRDLFGGGGGDLATAQDVQTSAPMFASGAAMDPNGGGATGQRNENSVLFSLAALTSIAAQPQGSSSGGAAIKDDSGLIDLKAMTAAATTAKRISEVPAAPLFPVASPFGVEQPILAAPSDAPQARSRLPLFIGLGAGAFAVLATIGIVIIVKLSATKPVEVIEVPAAVSTAPVASTAPEDTSSAASTAAPPSTASPSASVAKTTPSRPKPGTAARPGAAPAGPGAAPAAAPATKPAAVHTGSCGCSGDDLMCQIKCAAGKH